MNNTNFLERLQRLPVPVLPTLVGAATLSNVYSGLGFTAIRHITMITATIVWFVYLIKIIKHPKVCIGEYSNTVPASLYAGFTMVMMLLGSYYITYIETLGKGLWYVGVFLHILHILVFTFKNVVSSRNIETFVPSWFVTYNGILVSGVVGAGFGNPTLLKVISYYGIAVYAIIIPVMVYRLWKHTVPAAMYHTQAIVLAPCSLCLVVYLNVVENPSAIVVDMLYLCVLVSLLFVLYKLPKFFSHPFTPAFAGLTFPMAIGIVASSKMAAYMVTRGHLDVGEFIVQLAGIQVYITTAIITFVLFHFLKMIQRKKG